MPPSRASYSLRASSRWIDWASGEPADGQYHLETIDVMTGKPVLTFTYDGKNRLIRIRDDYGKDTIIAAMQAQGDTQLMETLTKNLNALSILGGGSVVDIAQKLFAGMPVGAGYSATSANEAAGARSRLAAWIAALVVLGSC